MPLSFGDEYQDEFDNDDEYDLPEYYGDDLDQVDEDWDEDEDELDDEDDYDDDFIDDEFDDYEPDYDDEDE